MIRLSYSSSQLFMIATIIVNICSYTTIFSGKNSKSTTLLIGAGAEALEMATVVYETTTTTTANELDDEFSSLFLSSNKNNDTTPISSMLDEKDQFNNHFDDDKYASTMNGRNSSTVTTVSFNTMDGDNDYFYDPSATTDHRQLHILSTCPLFRVFFLFLAECDCHYPLLDYPFLKGKIDIDCSRFVCTPLGSICRAVNFTTGFQLWPPAIDTGLCVDKISLISNSNKTAGPFCLGLVTRQLRNDCPNGIVNCLHSGKAAKIKKLNNEVVGCNIKIEGELCNSCTPCDKTGGVTFDCSNVVGGFKTSSCAKFPVWLGPGSRSTGTLPLIELDKY